MMRPLLRVLAPAGRSARLSVLIYHRVHAERDPLFPGEVDAAFFDRQLCWLKRWFNVLPLAEAVAGLRAGTLPARPATITFDDGYADNYRVALPILQRHALPATFFIASGFLDGGRMWNDTLIESLRRCPGESIDLTPLGLGRHPIATPGERRQAIANLIPALKYLPTEARQQCAEAVAAHAGVDLPDDLMLRSGEVREMAAAGMEIGGHTVRHPILARTADDEAYDEIVEGRQALALITGRPVRFFAYPNGKPDEDYAGQHVRMAREAGFSAAVSTAWGAAGAASDPYQIPRFTPWDRSAWRFGLRLAQNLRRNACATVRA